MFEIGETVFYSKDGFSTTARVKAIRLDENNLLTYVIITAGGDKISTTREHICSPSVPDVGWIPSSVPDYQKSAADLTEDQIKEITSPKHLSPLQQEFLSVHCKLFHLPFHIMLRMSKIGLLLLTTILEALQ